ncbi:MAG: RNase adapter RapZ [Deltaproteobacteria bacterium]|nr:RNase adapter RapZ [Deltaproteobacteria bacterium]
MATVRTSEGAAARDPKQVVVISGMAGAGKTTAARALEDLGFFVVDNLPPTLIETLISLSDSSGGGLGRLAFVIDAREPQFLKDFGPTWDRLRAAGHQLMLVFLDASDDALVRRFQETRRRHPLDTRPDVGGESVLPQPAPEVGLRAAILRERQLLADVAMRADLHLDTKDLSVHQLKRVIAERFGLEAQRRLSVTVLSFGFKHGVPAELDLCFDARFLPNPFFVDALRPLAGTDAPVRDFVLGQPDAKGFVTRVDDLLAFLLPRFVHEGKSYVTVAVGCTGGRHRSPALAAELADRLRARGIEARVVHRDIGTSG